MQTQELRNAINQLFLEHARSHGFIHRSSSFDYIRKQKAIAHVFRVYIYPKTGWWSVAPCVFFVSSQVNGLYNKALGENRPVNEITCGYAIRNQVQKRGTYSVDAPSDIPSVVQNLKLDFDEIALPEFMKVKDLQALESFMNQRWEHGVFRPHSVSHACLGIIAAWLCGNREFEQIFRDYYEFCRNSQGELADSIKTVRQYLDATKAAGSNAI